MTWFTQLAIALLLVLLGNVLLTEAVPVRYKNVTHCDNDTSCATNTTCQSCVDESRVCLPSGTKVCCGCIQGDCWACSRESLCQVTQPFTCDIDIHEGLTSAPVIAAIATGAALLLLLIIFIILLVAGVFTEDPDAEREIAPVVVYPRDRQHTYGAMEGEHVPLVGSAYV